MRKASILLGMSFLCEFVGSTLALILGLVIIMGCWVNETLACHAGYWGSVAQLVENLLTWMVRVRFSPMGYVLPYGLCSWLYSLPLVVTAVHAITFLGPPLAFHPIF